MPTKMFGKQNITIRFWMDGTELAITVGNYEVSHTNRSAITVGNSLR